MTALVLVVMFLVLAAPARAGTYVHHSVPGLDGWSPAAAAPGRHVSTGVEPGALWAGFFGRTVFDPGDVAEWSYAAPEATLIREWGFDRQVAGIGPGDWNTLFYAITDGRARLVAWDVPSLNRPWGRVHAGGLAASRLIARLVCGGPRPCHRSALGATLRVRAVRVVLDDPHAPAVGAVQGDLARREVVSGTERLSFSAVDRGAGLYRTVVEVDGRPRAPVVIDPNGGLCRDLVPGDGTLQFAFRVPCPSAASATIALDTTALTDGRHTVTAYVEDAAGNRSVVYGPSTKTVANRPPAKTGSNRPPAAAPVAGHRAVVRAWLERGRRRARTMTARYGERVRIRGRVTAAGRPVGGAALVVTEDLVDGYGRTLRAALNRSSRGSWPAVTGLRTRPNGRFTAFTRVGPSRRIGILAPGGARAPRLVLRVRAPVRASLDGATVRGRVGGGRVPRGALVEVQTRARGRWLTARILRTRRHGRFAGRLRSMPPGRMLRVRAPRQPRLPYAAGSARVSPPRRAGRTAARTSR